ncbi:MAG TPA: phenylalanine--tRNA ligase subunit beta [Candidatus Aenigmarchaeota archaeon]|nr:phenylalanine--tRNA ligase subunit beta [Candidatus Aenigmarchaeota archaeon]
MPLVEIDLADLRRLIGSVNYDQIKEAMPLNKMEIDEWFEDKGKAKIEVTHDRIDLLSIEGMARQLRAWLGITTGLIKYPVLEPKIEMRTKSVALRPYIVCGVIRDITLDDYTLRCLMQFQEAIDFTLGRDRKKVAIGIHDLNKVEQPFYYKEVGLDEVAFVPLGFKKEMTIREIIAKHPKGMQYAHLVNAEKVPIIVDKNNNVLSFPPIINGELTKVTEETKDLFFEITGTDMKSISDALNIITTSLYERGAKIEGVKIKGKVKGVFPDLEPRQLRINVSMANSVLGINISASEMKVLLERMGYGVVNIGKGRFDVLIPPYRTDILHPIDVIEDIAIAYGYNDIKPELPKLPTIGKEDERERVTNIIRMSMVGLGFQEVLNFTLTSKEKQTDFVKIKDKDFVEIKNPVSKEYNVCRKYIFPLLLDVLSSNKHRRFPQKIFEIGDCVFLDNSADVRTRNVRKMAAAISYSSAGLADILSVINAFMNAFDIKYELKPAHSESFIKGRCGDIIVEKENIGYFGELHPAVLNTFDLEKPVVVFEIDVEKLMRYLR